MLKYLLSGLLATVLFSSAFADPFVIARVSSNPKKTVDRLKPVAEAVISGAELSQFDSVEVRVFSDLDSLIADAKQGNVHWVSESAYAAAMIHHETELNAYLRRHKKGVASYGSVLLSDKTVVDMSSLVGKTLAAEDDGSFSGYFLVYRELKQLGLPINFLSNLRDSVSPDHVNIIFSNDEENSWAWISRGLVNSSIFSDTDLEESGHLLKPQAENLKVLWQSASYPRAVELFSTTLGEDAIERIIAALEALEAEDQHPVLKAYEKSYNFDRLTEEDFSNLDSIYEFAVNDES